MINCVLNTLNLYYKKSIFKLKRYIIYNILYIKILKVYIVIQEYK